MTLPVSNPAAAAHLCVSAWERRETAAPELARGGGKERKKRVEEKGEEGEGGVVEKGEEEKLEEEGEGEEEGEEEEEGETAFITALSSGASASQLITTPGLSSGKIGALRSSLASPGVACYCVENVGGTFVPP